MASTKTSSTLTSQKSAQSLHRQRLGDRTSVLSLQKPQKLTLLQVFLATLTIWSELVRPVESLIPNACNGVLDVVFIIDQSESISENDPYGKPDHNWNVYKDFIKAVVTGLPVGTGDTRVALIKYSSTSEVMWRLNTHVQASSIYTAVDGLYHNGGNTNTSGALATARNEVFREELGDRPYAANIIILMTDGLSTINGDQVASEAMATRVAGIDIYVVAIGKYVDQDELRSMVPDFSKFIIQVEDFSELKFIQTLLLHRVCGIDEPEPDFPDPPECDNLMDLALIVDNSGSVGDNYEQLKRFLANVVDQFDVRGGKHRIAVVRFSDIAELEFRLGEITDIETMKRLILDMSFRDLDTNTSGGIRLTKQQVFSGSAGDRPRVRNVALLITDGKSTVEEEMTLLEAQKAKDAGIKFFVVGVTNEINIAELKAIASSSWTDHYFDSTAVKYLNALIYRLVTNICTKN